MGRIFGWISRFFSIIVMGLVIVGVLYAGTCVYANFIYKQPGEYALPSKNQAQFEILIRNTRNVIFTDEYETENGAYTLKGYWELVDNKYERRKGEIKLDPAIFGTITVRRR